MEQAQKFPHAYPNGACGVTGLTAPCGCFACQEVLRKLREGSK